MVISQFYPLHSNFEILYSVEESAGDEYHRYAMKHTVLFSLCRNLRKKKRFIKLLLVKISIENNLYTHFSEVINSVLDI